MRCLFGLKLRQKKTETIDFDMRRISKFDLAGTVRGHVKIEIIGWFVTVK